MSVYSRGVEALYAAGHWFLCAREIEKAIVVFQALMLSAAEDERGWLGVAACHEEAGESDLALGIYELASESVTHRSRIEHARARLLHALDRTDEADAAAALALDLAIEDGEVATERDEGDPR